MSSISSVAAQMDTGASVTRMIKDSPATFTGHKIERIMKIKVSDPKEVDQKLQEMNQDPRIQFAEKNCLMKASFVPTDQYYSVQTTNAFGNAYENMWALKKLNPEPAWDVTKGENVVVAVVDSGVDYQHADLAANIWVNPGEDLNNNGVADAGDYDGIDTDNNGYVDDLIGWDFIGNDNNPDDLNAHGTHVAGTIAAVQNNIGIVGVAPSAKIIGVRGLDREGFGSVEALADGIRYAAMMNADIINMSFGGEFSNVTCAAVDFAIQEGSLPVAAAGNSAVNAANSSPAGCANAFTVSSTEMNNNQTDILSYFSNFGAVIDIAAPGGGLNQNVGLNILSLLARNYNTDPPNPNGGGGIGGTGLFVGNGYVRFQGTSMAAPHVSGVAALVKSRNPNMTPQQLGDTLKATAKDIGQAGNDDLYGAGLVSAADAVGAGVDPNAPRFLTRDQYKINLNQKFSLPISVSDPNGDTVQVSAESLPGDATFDANTLLFSWTPKASDLGQHQVVFIATDGSNTNNTNISFDVVDESNQNNVTNSRNNVQSSVAGCRSNEGSILIWFLMFVLFGIEKARKRSSRKTFQEIKHSS